MELKDLARILNQRRMIVIVVTLVITALAAASGFAPESSYTATAQVLAPQTTVSSVISAGRPLRGIEWQASIARSAEVLERASATLGDSAAGQLAGSVSVAASTIDSEYLLTITASAATPEAAAARANAVADAYVAITAEKLQSDVGALVGELAAPDADASQLAGGLHDGASIEALVSMLQSLPSLDSARARVLTTASAPSIESALSRVIRLGLLGLTLGVLLGVAAAFVVDQLDDRLMSMNGLRRRSGVPLVAGIAGLADHAGDSDTLLILASRLAAAGEKTVLVASPDAPALARITGTALAAAFARSGARAVVIDCDLRQPDGALGSGLGQALATPERAADLMMPLESGAFGLGATAPADDPLRLLTSAGMRGLVTRLLDANDVVVLLAPDWTLPSDTLALAPLASTAVVPVILGRSRSHALESLTQALAANGVDVAAVLARGGVGWHQRAGAGMGTAGC